MIPAATVVCEESLGICREAGVLATAATIAGQAGAPVSREKLMSATALALLGVILVLLVFIVVGLVLLRVTRRHRDAFRRSRPVPTPSQDVWRMHKVPEEIDDERNGGGVV